jgi:hypothetical protein
MRTKFKATLYALLTLSVSVHAEDPEKLISLRTSWERARDQATQPIDVKYKVALKQLLDSFTKNGDLTAALAVKVELDKVSTTPPNVTKSTLSERSTKIKYRYEFFSEPCVYSIAVERAKAAGGIIAFPRSERDMNEFRDLADKAKAPQIWLGVTREPFSESNWICADGSELAPQLASKVQNLEKVQYTNLRLGEGSGLSTHHSSAPLPFIIAIQD